MGRIITQECRGKIIPYHISLKSFNCGSLALGVTSWVYLDDFMKLVRHRGSVDLPKELIRCLRDNNNIRNVRVIKNLDDITDSEYPVLFRWCKYDNDDEFHFLRLYKGVWIEKYGTGEITESSMTTDELLNNTWVYDHIRYDSEVIMLAVDKATIDIATIERVDVSEYPLYVPMVGEIQGGDNCVLYSNTSLVFTSLEDVLEFTKSEAVEKGLKIFRITRALTYNGLVPVNCMGYAEDCEKLLLRSEKLSKQSSYTRGFFRLDSLNKKATKGDVVVYNCTYILTDELPKGDTFDYESKRLVELLSENDYELDYTEYNSYGLVFQTFEDKDFGDVLKSRHYKYKSMSDMELKGANYIVGYVSEYTNGKIRVLRSPYEVDENGEEYLVVLRYDPVSMKAYFAMRYDNYWVMKPDIEPPTVLDRYADPITCDVCWQIYGDLGESKMMYYMGVTLKDASKSSKAVSDEAELQVIKNVKDYIPHGIDYLEFNCGGFAFDTYDWLDLEIDYSDGFEGCCDYIMEQLINDYKLPVRVVQSEKELEEDEYLVMMKIDITEDDYHFIRNFNGTWVEKCGENDIEIPSEYDLAFEDWYREDGDVCYDSPVLLIAVKDRKYKSSPYRYEYRIWPKVFILIDKELLNSNTIPLLEVHSKIYDTEEDARADLDDSKCIVKIRSDKFNFDAKLGTISVICTTDRTITIDQQAYFTNPAELRVEHIDKNGTISCSLYRVESCSKRNPAVAVF